jgi:phosphatidylglycerol:prolipoprotein diacylglycerol transferase
VHGLAYHETYLVDPARVLDVSVGSFSLSGAVIGGVFAGVYIATLLEGATRRWADVAAVPLLVAIGIGKVGQFLGGGGQGAFWEGPWAVAFTGAGPWTSAAAAVPAHPVALYEAVWYLAGIPVVVWGSSRLGAWWSPVHGSGLGIAVCWFLGGRALLGIFWRDDPVIGPFNVEQAVATVALGVIVAVSIQRALRRDARLRAAERAGLVPPRQPHG